MRRIILLLGAGFLLACAARTPKACEPVPADILTAASQLVYSKCQVDQQARQPLRPRLDFTPTTTPTQQCHSATVEFVIDPSGKAVLKTLRIVKVNDLGLADALMQAIPNMRFQPAMKDGAPVAQIDSITQTFQVMTVVRRSPGGGPPAGVSRANAQRC